MVNTLSKNTKIVPSLLPDLRTTNNTTVEGSWVDRQGFNDVMITVGLGVWGDTTTGGIDFALQATNDTTAAADAADADLSSTVAGAETVTGAPASGYFARINALTEDEQVYSTDYIGDKRYLRVVMVANGNQSTGTDTHADINLFNPQTAPVSYNNA